ncbi:MAG: hypothetical protein FWC46_07505, partial [Actinomycetia bacterium]|nr:hypothetical protein [Actinomycetes bacterium]
TAAPNPGTTARDVSVTFTGGGLTSTIKGSQAGQPGTLHDCGRTSLTLCSWLTLNTPIMGSIDAPGDVQWFIFTAPASGTWVFTSSAPASGALPDPRAWVLTGDGTTQLGYNDDANYPSDLQFRVSANLMATQPYKIMVSGYGGQTGGYTITATPPGGLVDDCGNTPTTACAWPDLTKPMSGRLEMLEDVDWFRITPSVSGTWTFTSSGGAPDGVRDPVGFLYAADGTTRIAYNNDVDNPSNLQFQLSATLTAGQTYYLRVSAYTSQLNCGYTITATRG